MNILLLEDEAIAAKQLTKYLQNYFSNDVTIRWYQTVADGLAYLQSNPSPDLILSDIELLDGRAFDIYEQHAVEAPIIFITAYDNFLMDAFNTNGIAYLLKPYASEDLIQALDKYLSLFKKTPQDSNQALIKQFNQVLNDSQKSYKTKFTIKKSNGIFFLETNNIVYFKADGDIVFAHDTEHKRHLISYRIAELEQHLDPKQFFQINRGEVINVSYLEKMETYFGNRLALYLKGEAETLKTSGPKTSAFRKWVEGL